MIPLKQSSQQSSRQTSARWKSSAGAEAAPRERKIGVIIPCYNVKDTIAGVIRGIPDFVDRIIVVNDASSDDTYDQVLRLADPRVMAINHEVNKGVGGAMLTGYRMGVELGMDVLVKMDGDGQMNPDHLEDLVEPLVTGRAHYAKGNRFNDQHALDSMPPLRRFGNGWLSFLTKWVSGYWHIFDVTNGYTALLADTFRRLDTRRVASGYYFETSMLVELNIIGARVADVDMPSIYGDEKSNLRIRRVVLSFPLKLMRSYLRRFYYRYLIRDFNALSLCAIIGWPLFAFGVLYALSLWIHPPQLGEPTPAGTVMLAALPIILGFQLVLTSLILDVVFTPQPLATPHDDPHFRS